MQNYPNQKLLTVCIPTFNRADRVAMLIQELYDFDLNDRINIKFASPQRSVTPGQSVVIYQDNKCLGGGEISTIN